MELTTVRAILDAGAQAPSGENAQPWRFEVTDHQISLLNVPQRDQSLYNFRQRASYIAHGAVIENIVIAASQFGYSASVSILPDKNEADLIAHISLEAASGSKEAHYGAIAKRSTNRKPYKAKSIDPNIIQELITAGQNSGSVTAKITTVESDIATLAQAASNNDRLLLENKLLHDFFFDHVHWTEEEEKQKRSGFYIEVLELLPPAKVLFRVFKHWPIMSVLNALGFAKIGAKENTKIYAASAAMGCLVLSNTAPESFIAAGRSLQKLWLTATDHDLSMQPLTGVLFFNQRIQEKEAEQFSETHKEIIQKAYTTIASTFGVTDGTIAMMFRIGYADAPTAHSLKMSPEITMAP